jgi:hypothetical protein
MRLFIFAKLHETKKAHYYLAVDKSPSRPLDEQKGLCLREVCLNQCTVTDFKNGFKNLNYVL